MLSPAPIDSDGHRDPNDKKAIDTVNEFATHYAARYNPIVGCTKSLDTTDAVGYIPDFEVR
jgi:hypothetical protein